MKPIFQKRNRDCAIACLAMYLNVSYWKAAWLMHSWKCIFAWLFDISTPTKLIISAAQKHNKTLIPYELLPHATIEDLIDNAIIIVGYDEDWKHSHAVIWDATNKCVIDPIITCAPLKYFEDLQQYQLLFLMEN